MQTPPVGTHLHMQQLLPGSMTGRIGQGAWDAPRFS
jgi:hypothetical protein